MKINLKFAWTTTVMLLGLLAANTGCGYRVRSSVGSLPENIHSLGIPTFENLTSQYKLEQTITSAVLNAFNNKTRIPVHSKNTGVDAVLLGEIRSLQSTPIAFENRSFGSAFLVTVRMSARLIRQKDSRVIWQNRNFTFVERYALNSDVSDFFSEENPAIERLASAFAESLVNTIIESQSLDSPNP